MAKIKISSKVGEREWAELRAVADHVRRRRLRSVVLSHLETSMEENQELGQRLAR